jgi:carbon monoxide dehydrogenase subunit G
MRLEQSFEMPVPVALAWPVLLDLERTAGKWPGATLTSFDGGAFTGTLSVKLGTLSLVYRGQGRVTEQDEPGHRISLVAQGQDSTGAGGASARIAVVLHSTDGGASTLAKVVADVDLTGPAAMVDAGLLSSTFAAQTKQFAVALAADLPASPVVAAAEASTDAVPGYEPLEVSIDISPYDAPTFAMVDTFAVAESVVDGVAPTTPPVLAPLFQEPGAPVEPPDVAEPEQTLSASILPPAPLTPPPPPGWRPAVPVPAADAVEPVATPVDEDPAVEPSIEQAAVIQTPIDEASVEQAPSYESVSSAPVAYEAVPDVAVPDVDVVAVDEAPDDEPAAVVPDAQYFAPMPAYSAPPEYHPLALQDPPADASDYPTPSWSVSAATEPEAPAAPTPEPEAPAAPTPEPAVTAGPVASPPEPIAAEAEPAAVATLLPPPPVPATQPAVANRKTARWAIPMVIIIGIAIVGLIVWLNTR